MSGDTSKVYAGDRTIDGIVVTVNGEPLNERLDLEAYSEMGFEWTYEGGEPHQLALAILADFLGDDERARRLSAGFMQRIVAHFDNTWEMSGADVAAAITALES
jgi:hypothetical protein